MRIAMALVILIGSGLLWMVDMTSAVRDFRVDVRQDDFTVVTPAAVNSANVVLVKTLFENDTNTISYLSTIVESAVPTFSSFNTTSRQLLTANLTAGVSRTLTVLYDTNALTRSTALNTFLDFWPFMWFLLITVFPIAALVAIFTGR